MPDHHTIINHSKDIAAAIAGIGSAFVMLTQAASVLTVWLGLFTAAASAFWWARKYWKLWRD